MIRAALRKLGKFLSSALLATLLLVFLGLWSVLASFIPQTAVSPELVESWALAHPIAEPVVSFFGLHHAFSSPLFIVGVVLLTISTALCAWQRTRVAITKARILRSAHDVGAEEILASHDLEVDCDPALSDDEILTIAAGTLTHIGIKAKREGSVLRSASSAWSAWGSPVFHWALLALILTMAFGGLQRASGLVGLAVGETKVDQSASYGKLTAGPLHGWGSAPRSIRLDAFERHYTFDGLDRGPTPTVTVLDAQGNVIKSQQVYPNKTLKTGSLTVYPSEWGLSASVALLDASGAVTGRSSRLIDFSGETTQGTQPVGYLTVNDSSGAPSLKVYLNVPLDLKGDVGLKRVPTEPKARVVVASMDNKILTERVLTPGESISLPTGDTLRLEKVGYYARLQLVDDASIPFLYAALVIAALGLSLATLSQQQIVLATIADTPEGAKLCVRMRLWRNVTTSRSEIESELIKALGGTEKETTT